MICARCATAADQHAPRTAHCNSTGCPCGHRTHRYDTATTQPTPTRKTNNK